MRIKLYIYDITNNYNLRSKVKESNIRIPMSYTERHRHYNILSPERLDLYTLELFLTFNCF